MEAALEIVVGESALGEAAEDGGLAAFVAPFPVRAAATRAGAATTSRLVAAASTRRLIAAASTSRLEAASATCRLKAAATACGLKSATAAGWLIAACLATRTNCRNGASRADLLQIDAGRRTC